MLEQQFIQSIAYLLAKETSLTCLFMDEKAQVAKTSSCSSASAKQDVLTAIERAEIISSNLNEKLLLEDHESQLKWLQEHVLWGPNDEDITLTSHTSELGPRKLFYYGHLVKVTHTCSHHDCFTTGTKGQLSRLSL
ncbi:uncharacterized protein LOC142337063 [Convolutriloba macropyga]|uniref:uncharacterized protein LOC142337063 n=1 Tax=Convolutriloba macropyga TaxID=536237 RepID=UPI003F521C53